LNIIQKNYNPYCSVDTYSCNMNPSSQKRVPTCVGISTFHYPTVTRRFRWDRVAYGNFRDAELHGSACWTSALVQLISEWLILPLVAEMGSGTKFGIVARQQQRFRQLQGTSYVGTTRSTRPSSHISHISHIKAPWSMRWSTDSMEPKMSQGCK